MTLLRTKAARMLNLPTSHVDLSYESPDSVILHRLEPGFHGTSDPAYVMLYGPDDAAAATMHAFLENSLKAVTELRIGETQNATWNDIVGAMLRSDAMRLFQLFAPQLRLGGDNPDVEIGMAGDPIGIEAVPRTRAGTAGLDELGIPYDRARAHHAGLL